MDPYSFIWAQLTTNISPERSPLCERKENSMKINLIWGELSGDCWVMVSARCWPMCSAWYIRWTRDLDVAHRRSKKIAITLVWGGSSQVTVSAKCRKYTRANFPWQKPKLSTYIKPYYVTRLQWVMQGAKVLYDYSLKRWNRLFRTKCEKHCKHPRKVSYNTNFLNY